MMSTLTDYITGRTVADTGAEANRQAFERYLVNKKGYAKTDIEVDAPIQVMVQDEPYTSRIDLLVSIDGVRLMAIKCAAGSLGSWEREVVAAARLLDRVQVPFAVVTDGSTAHVVDTASGTVLTEALGEIMSRKAAKAFLETYKPTTLPEERRSREALIYRSYDSMNVNVKG
jgi:hypothetical protein